MASGKSTVGRVLAKEWSTSFLDLDSEIEKQSGMTIPELFAQFGEEKFREIERDVLRRVAQNNRDVVLSTGGGAVTRQENRRLLSESFVTVYLRASVDTIIDRLTRDGTERPLLQGANPRERVSSLLGARSGWYEEVSKLTVDVDGLSVSKVVDEIARWVSRL